MANNSLNSSEIEPNKTTGYKVTGIAKPFKKRKDAIAKCQALGLNYHTGDMIKVHDYTDFAGQHYLNGKTCLQADLTLLEIRKSRKLLRINREIKKLQAKARLYR